MVDMRWFPSDVHPLDSQKIFVRIEMFFKSTLLGFVASLLNTSPHTSNFPQLGHDTLEQAYKMTPSTP